MTAQHMLWPRVCLSIRYKPYQNRRTEDHANNATVTQRYANLVTLTFDLETGPVS